MTNKNMDPSESPSSSKMLGGGVRINKRPVLLITLIGGVVLAALFYSVYQRDHSNFIRHAKQPRVAQSGGAMNNVMNWAPKGAWWVKAAVAHEKKTKGPNLGEPSSGTVPSGERKMPLGPRQASASPGHAQLTPEQTQDQKYERRIRQMKEDALVSAITASTSIPMPGLEKTGTVTQPENQGNNPAAGELRALKKEIARLQGANPSADMNSQNEKVAFLNKQKSMGYLLHKREAPFSPYEIKTGTIIPAIMISGINSDLPGEIVGQVSQNVYDTATGKYLLIPQGARLIGDYDSHVTYGQNRVLVVWRRIVFPDASSINLDTMPGTDEAGYAGFHDKVDNHYFRIFGQALLVSAFTAGIELSQPQPTSALAYPSTSQQVSESLGQQMGQLGMSIAQRNMDIQPTIKIRPGYRFTVLVNKDIILQPYSRMAPQMALEGQ